MGIKHKFPYGHLYGGEDLLDDNMKLSIIAERFMFETYQYTVREKCKI